MSRLIYTCDACEVAGREFAWLDSKALRELVRRRAVDADAVEVSTLCSHSTSAIAGTVLWLGPTHYWTDGLRRFAPVVKPCPATLREARQDRGWEDETMLRHLAGLPQDKLTIGRVPGAPDLIVVDGEFLRWIGERSWWQEARLPYLREQMRVPKAS
jgi:hypothetical protein